MILHFFAALWALLVVASTSALAADAARGREKAEPCLACHGETGNSEMEEVPSLAGQPAPYLAIQLIMYREQLRKDPRMTPFAKDLSDQDTEDLAAFFAAQAAKPPGPPDDPALAAEGKRIADAHHCGSCHLPDYSGREQMARLAGQRADYFAKTMRDYKAGTRISPDGSMNEVVYGLSDRDIAALAEYLAHLP